MKRYLPFTFVLLAIATWCGPALAESPTPAQTAASLYSLLARGLLTTNNPLYPQILAAVQAGNLLAAAHVITDNVQTDSTFYDSAYRQFCATWFEEAANPGATLNERIATCMGLGRDGNPVSDMFTAPLTYNDPNLTATPYVAGTNNNNHFVAIDATESPAQHLVQASYPNNSGIFTLPGDPTQLDGYQAGTIRRKERMVIQDMFCTPLTSIENPNLPSYKVRRDHILAQTPTSCLGCHDRLDGAYGAFDHYKFNGNTTNIDYIGATTYNDQLDTVISPTFSYANTDAWSWYMTTEENNSIFGITVPATGPNTQGDIMEVTGNALPSFMSMVLTSTGFANCAAQRVVTQIYLGTPWTSVNNGATLQAALASQAGAISQLATGFQSSQSFVDLFRQTAVYYVGLSLAH